MARLRKPKDPPTEEAVALGARVREAVEAAAVSRKTTIKAIGKEIGVEPHTLNRYMSGQTSPSAKLWDISRVTGRSVEWLRGEAASAAPDQEQGLIERFIQKRGLGPKEASYLRRWPWHGVNEEKLERALRDGRAQMTPTEEGRTETQAAQRRYASVGGSGRPARRS